MFHLDLKRADVAIAGGRLDEAFQILRTPSERQHREGQRLIDRLVAALIERATQHLDEQRLQDARCDADRARQLGGRQPVIAELFEKISAADADQRIRQQQREQVLASARQQMQAGEYSLGARLLVGLQEDATGSTVTAADQLAKSIEAQRAVQEKTAERIQQAIDRQDFEAAVQLISRLSSDQQAAAPITALTQQVVEPLVSHGLSELAAGRLDRAAVTDERLRSLASLPAAAAELRLALDQCRTIHASLAAHEYAQAEAQLRVLARMIEGSTWVEDTRQAVSDIVQQRNEVAAGPLSLLTGTSGMPSVPASTPVSPPARFSEPAGHHAAGLPVRSVLQVDGLGRLLLLTADIVSIGSTASPRADVALQTEGLQAAISIRRDGDDYFAESTAGFTVNGQSVMRRLLVSGDTIGVGSRGRLRFQKPVPASGSAILQITGARTARRDIRNVVLMSDSLLFGPSGCHFRLEQLHHPLVLHSSRDGFGLRESALRTADRPAATRPQSATLFIGHSIVSSDVRFALMEAKS